MNQEIKNNIIEEYFKNIGLQEGEDYTEFLEELREKHGNQVVGALNNVANKYFRIFLTLVVFAFRQSMTYST